LIARGMVKHIKIKPVRLDALVVRAGFAESVDAAARIIVAREITVDGKYQTKPGESFPSDSVILQRPKPLYVSRGGLKLKAALENFKKSVDGLVCADLGSSTGGFTDCLLQHGAQRVYAVDNARGELDWKLRSNPQVVVMERTDATRLESLPEAMDLAVIDVSLLSIKKLLSTLKNIAPKEVIALVKPQYEVSKEELPPGAIVQDSNLHRKVLHDIIDCYQQAGFYCKGVATSPIKGGSGNTEFLVYFAVQPKAVVIEELLKALSQIP